MGKYQIKSGSYMPLYTWAIFAVLATPFGDVNAANMPKNMEKLYGEISMHSIPQQQLTVKGKVTNETGEVLEGVSVLVKGTSGQGTSTGADGTFSIQVANGSTLLFQMVGYTSQEIAVQGENFMQVTLTGDQQNLEEVVVVGFGTQKKVNLTGAVASIKGDDMKRRPVANAASMLQGQVPGLSIVQGSGEPGNEGVSIRMRGQGTFSGAGNNPLVLIDGVEGSLSSLNPNDIENVSVLKDAASASIYGSRAANGVILVTTRTGAKGQTIVDYSNNLAIHTPTKLFDLITNSAEYMELWNEAKRNTGISTGLYSQELIDLYRNADDREKYPNTDWLDIFFNPAFVHQHNVGISGGGDKTQYNLSMGYVNQPGSFKGFDYERFNVRLNLTSQVNNWFKIGTNIHAKQGNTQRPRQGGEDAFVSAMSQAPTYSPQLADGRYVYKAYDFEANNKNMLALIDNEVFYKNRDYALNFQGWFEAQLAPGLSWYTKGAINVNLDNESDWRPVVPLYNFVSGEQMTNLDVGANGLSKNRKENRYTNAYSYLKYDRAFGSHQFGAQVGYSYEANQYQFLNAYRQYFYNGQLQELNAGGTAVQTNGGSTYEWALQSVFGRLNYNYQGKYMVEGNFRYDGSSRFRSDLRWGMFPSFSAAWRLTEESFMKENENFRWLNEFKLRGSWGLLGNQNINLNDKPYPYQDVYDFTGNYSYDNSNLSTGIAQSTLPNRDITWEKTAIYDIGADMRLFNNLELTVDWYRKDTRDILRSIQLTDLVGLSAPAINSGAVRNQGIEFALTYRNSISSGFFDGLSYSVGGNIDHFKNTVTEYGARDIGSWTIKENGQPWDSFYLLEVIGIFQTQTEVANAPKQYNDNTLPGDLIYKDQNGDGVVNDNDRILMDGAFPSFQYALNGSVNWKNIDLSVLFQGVEGRSLYVNNWGIVPFVQGAAPTTEWRNRWTEENPSTTMPRIYWGWDSPQKFSRPSSYFLRDASYLRLKNLTIGYTIAPERLAKMGIRKLRVFASGDNLFTSTSYPGLDPERGGSGTFITYPQNKIYSFGVNVQF